MKLLQKTELITVSHYMKTSPLEITSTESIEIKKSDDVSEDFQEDSQNSFVAQLSSKMMKKQRSQPILLKALSRVS